ncbi:MFS transporter [Campylobacter sp. RM16704]|uniref:MFS transporter n=1 Tax=Campylobacter sp. RM16704 TaxID=1500960 RepID=UPI00057F10F8|nr:MFS transporter [Campylobacter sp. RM16704]AJC85658.1 major facilitator superfamily transporter [Campylobacter sp. RM16704]
MSKNLSRKDIKVLGLSSLGGTLEFYDFIIFVFFASYISKNFFPENLSPFWQMFNTYGIFAAGYLARPLGGIVMAHFGDKFGRKKMFMLSILLMVIPTFMLAFIPGYESIGYLCIVLLVSVRICQGIAIGGELPGAWVFVFEHAPKGQKRTYLGFLTASVVGGILLGSIVFLIMNKLYTQEELYEWAWRIPFFLGGIFGIISVYLRKFLRETPVFEQMKKDKALEKFPLKEVFKKAKLGIVASMLITWVLTACIVVMILIIPSFMAKMLNIDASVQTYMQMLGIVILVIGCILSGILADKIGIVKSCIIFSIGFFFVCWLYFNALYVELPDFNQVCIYYLTACFFAGVLNFCPLIMSEVFDSKIKFSGLSFSYNIAYAIAGGFTPQLALFLHTFALKNLENIWRFSLGFYMLAMALIALLSVFIFKYLNNIQRTYSQ